MKLLRNYIIALGVIAVITVVLAAMSVTGTLTKADQVVIDPEDPMTVNPEEAGIDDLTRLLDLAVRNATPTETPNYFPASTTTLTLQTRTESGVFVDAYSLHVVSMINRSALLEDLQTGEFYQLSTRDFSRLLSHKAFSDLPERRFSEPILTVQSDDVSFYADFPANKATVFTYAAAGSFLSVSKDLTTETAPLELTVEQAAQNPQISLSVSPDAWSLTVTSGNTMSLSQSRVQEKELYFPTEAGTYTYTVTAHWDLSDQRDWYGEITYVFEIHITEPQTPDPLPEHPEGEDPDQ